MSSDQLETKEKILEATWRLMEERSGQNVRMSDIANASGISRQAVYLHFSSRTELMVATTHYIDQVCGLDERSKRYRAATVGIEILEEFIAFSGNYIPKIYRIAKALLAVRETDDAAAAAWNDRMASLRSGCQNVIDALYRDGTLESKLSPGEAVDLLWTMLSINNWEHLTMECGWSISQYVSRMQVISRAVFVQPSKEA
jgi:AcrR family transcriptional regulator